MQIHQWTEKTRIPIIGASNYESVEILWETRILDDGYVVVELMEFNVIAHGEVQ